MALMLEIVKAALRTIISHHHIAHNSISLNTFPLR